MTKVVPIRILNSVGAGRRRIFPQSYVRCRGWRIPRTANVSLQYQVLNEMAGKNGCLHGSQRVSRMIKVRERGLEDIFHAGLITRL